MASFLILLARIAAWRRAIFVIIEERIIFTKIILKNLTTQRANLVHLQLNLITIVDMVLSLTRFFFVFITTQSRVLILSHVDIKNILHNVNSRPQKHQHCVN